MTFEHFKKLFDICREGGLEEALEYDEKIFERRHPIIHKYWFRLLDLSDPYPIDTFIEKHHDNIISRLSAIIKVEERVLNRLNRLDSALKSYCVRERLEFKKDKIMDYGSFEVIRNSLPEAAFIVLEIVPTAGLAYYTVISAFQKDDVTTALCGFTALLSLSGILYCYRELKNQFKNVQSVIGH